MKIGEALIKARLITEEQLELALERQRVFSGRIDTNIVESGFLDDEKLTRFLGLFLKLPTVTSNLINSIPDDIINTMKKEVVEKYGILPFKKEGTRLHVAMLNPKNLKDIEDLRFMTGFDIIPYVITELKLRNALEKYYGIKKALRHFSLDTDTEIESVEIEMSESQFTKADTKKATEEISLDKIRKAVTVEKDAGKTAELIGALLSNAFFTAKLFYEMKRLNLTDSQIEDEVIRNWTRFQKKVVNLYVDNQ
jgi:type IV pilus assembly protein PilB